MRKTKSLSSRIKTNQRWSWKTQYGLTSPVLTTNRNLKLSCEAWDSMIVPNLITYSHRLTNSVVCFSSSHRLLAMRIVAINQLPDILELVKSLLARRRRGITKNNYFPACSSISSLQFCANQFALYWVQFPMLNFSEEGRQEPFPACHHVLITSFSALFGWSISLFELEEKILRPAHIPFEWAISLIPRETGGPDQVQTQKGL